MGGTSSGVVERPETNVQDRYGRTRLPEEVDETKTITTDAESGLPEAFRSGT